MLQRHTPMKRSGFARKSPAPAVKAERAPRPLYRLARPCAPARILDAATPIPKEKRTEHDGYRRLVAALPCAHCGIHGYSQAAHPNSGKAKGMKADDRLCFPLCCTRPGVPGCHFQFDQHQLIAGRPARQAAEQAWAQATATEIIAAGNWPADLNPLTRDNA